jgi:(1->4)-alpha-D-glucan 1-alpha-D-glucosylmutase
MPPRATIRLQFHDEFTFADAERLIDYFAAMGLSHVYASPVMTARPGSMHGYDSVDPMTVRPSLGGEAGLRSLSDALRARGMGLIIDIVPNHVGVAGNDNRWWMDVLEWGRQSEFAPYFDIDFEAPEPPFEGKVHLPVLGRPLGVEIDEGAIRLEYDPDERRLFFVYGERRFPVAPGCYRHVLGQSGKPENPISRSEFTQWLSAQAPDAFRKALGAFDPRETGGRNALLALLDRQHYRLAWWRTAGDEINWRRFFEINDLASLRMEDPAAFESVHETVFRLYADRVIDGVRVDHVDGLTDPRSYCRTLVERLTGLNARRSDSAAPYVVVEKILAAEEKLPADWNVAGTTGYDFLAEAGALLHDAEGVRRLRELWSRDGSRVLSFPEEERLARAQMLTSSFSSALGGLVDVVRKLALRDPRARDFSKGAISRALTAVLLEMPMYRTYSRIEGWSDAEASMMDAPWRRAMAAIPAPDRAIFDSLRHWLAAPIAADEANASDLLEARRRFEQLSSPLAAKSVEDTAFYRHGPLLSLNEVGSRPDYPVTSIARFHQICEARSREQPGAMLATATHDHKRGEDARARLAVVSETPDAWAAFLKRAETIAEPWIGVAGDEEALPRSDFNMLAQTIVGAWPLALSPRDAEGLLAFRERIAGWRTKSLREAKLRTSWNVPDAEYERRWIEAVNALLVAGSAFAELAREFVDTIAPAGAINGLAQTLLRLTAPGVPDLYQGGEFWDFSLVDPDNRQPVDFAARRAARGARRSRALRGSREDMDRWADQTAADRAGVEFPQARPRAVRAGFL